MAKAKKDINKLPRWAQKILTEKDREIKRLQGLRKLHAFLTAHENVDWFCIGPVKEDMTLFQLQNNHAHAICSLSEGDVLFVGRKKNKKEENNGK